MHSSSFRLISTIVSIALLAALVLVIGLAIRDNAASALPTLAIEAPTATPTHLTIDAAIPTSVQPGTPSGDTFRLPRGGFTFQIPTGYTLDISGDTARLHAEEGLARGMAMRTVRRPIRPAGRSVRR